jgi:hypothetical protein
MLKNSSETSSRGAVFTIDDPAVVGFPNLDAVRRIAIGNQGLLEFLEDVDGNVLGRGVLILESRMFVKVQVVERVDHFLDRVFGDPEIYGHPQFIQFRGPDRNFDLPVMTMRSFAVAGIITEMMAGREVGLYKDIEHCIAPVWPPKG